MGHRTFTTLSSAKAFAKKMLDSGYQTVSLFPYGTQRTKGYKVTVRYGDKSDIPNGRR